MPSTLTHPPGISPVPTGELHANALSLSIYGDPLREIDDLVESVRSHGILVPLVVAREGGGWEVVSGHRRLACARVLELPKVPCEVKSFPSRGARSLAVLQNNRQRRKTFSQLMREA